MSDSKQRKAIWGWMFYDWASQPFHTLVITFIFAPYFTTVVVGDAVAGQSVWGYGVAATGLLVALCAPVFGAIADSTGNRRSWVMYFSIVYVISAAALWWATPGAEAPWRIMIAFGCGLFAVEMATAFTNASLPEIAKGRDVGKVSGQGWGFGYLGGLVALALMLAFLAESADGKTMLGIPPIFGLNAAEYEGTRSVGPLTSIWYIIFIVPFFLWVPVTKAVEPRKTIKQSLSDLATTLRKLPAQRTLGTYLLSSMFFRDALNGIFAFGAIYAVGVLSWDTTQLGIFGILAGLTGALGAWGGGRLDARFGPGIVLYCSMTILIIASIVAISAAPGTLMGVSLPETSNLPSHVFMICGMLFGAAGGSLQASGRTALVRLAEPERMTEAFGLYAFAGRATAFLAPFLIAVVTDITNSQRAGIVPVVVLFIIGFILLMLVRIPAAEEQQAP